MHERGAGIASSSQAPPRRTRWTRSSTPTAIAPSSTPPKPNSAAGGCTSSSPAQPIASPLDVRKERLLDFFRLSKGATRVGERQKRRAAGNARHAGAQGLAARTDARLGDHRTYPAMVGGRAAARTGIALSSALSHGAARLHPLRVARHRQQPARALLLVDRARTTLPERVAGAVATRVARDQPRSGCDDVNSASVKNLVNSQLPTSNSQHFLGNWELVVGGWNS